MKRLIIILALLMPVRAAAQWYLFDTKPARSDTVATSPAKTVAEPAGETAAEDSTVYENDPLDCINAVLSLPLSAGSAEPNSHMYEFYAGAMLAVRDAGLEGNRIRFRTIDSNSEDERLSEEDCLDADILLCPMSISEIRMVQAMCPFGKHVISPLEKIPDGEGRIIQLQTPWKAQVESLASWVGEEAGGYDDIVVLHQKNRKLQSDTLRYLSHILDSLGVRYKTAEDIQPGHRVAGRTRYITVSANVAFLNTAARAISELNEKGDSLTLYTTSLIRNIRGINDSPVLYNAGARIVSQFEIDRAESQQFEMQFRSLFKSEPGRFAYHGYDSMKFFLEVCAEYGRNWPLRLQDKFYRGLQSDFNFDSRLTNCAVRRLVYKKDLSIEIQ